MSREKLGYEVMPIKISTDLIEKLKKAPGKNFTERIENYVNPEISISVRELFAELADLKVKKLVIDTDYIRNMKLLEFSAIMHDDINSIIIKNEINNTVINLMNVDKIIKVNDNYFKVYTKDVDFRITTKGDE